VKYRFYFVDITYTKKFLFFQNTLFLYFLSINNFFCSSNIEKIKTMLLKRNSPFYMVKISFLITVTFSLLSYAEQFLLCYAFVIDKNNTS